MVGFSASNRDADAVASARPGRLSRDTKGGNVKVAIRLCPVFEGEGLGKKRGRDPDVYAWTEKKVGATVSLAQKGYKRKVENRTVFHFDEVFDEDVQTPLVYQSVARPMVNDVLKGKHATIFAYGQTGSGKTFTMQGSENIKSGQAGIIQLVATDLFRLMQRHEASKREFEVKVSYFEIYNERIRDLLALDPDIASSDSSSFDVFRNDHVKIRTNAKGEIIVNVEQKKVNNVDEALTMLAQGNAHRTVAATDMNSQSSRSHSVFRLTVESSHREDEQQSVHDNGHRIVRVSDFNLVDLAGSESLKATKTTGIRQREGATINKSLLALTTVIQALSQPNKKKTQHINYRDSKLTRILQPHLSGNAEMAILCCASRAKNFLEETRSTFQFASRAKLVKVKPEINEVMDDGAVIKKLKHELCVVRKELELAERRIQEMVRDHVVSELTLNSKKAIFHSSNCIDNGDDKGTNKRMVSKPAFRLDAASPDDARKAVERYQSGRLDSFEPNEILSSSLDSTANLSSECERLNGKGNSSSSIHKLTGESQHKVEPSDSVAPTEDDSFNGPGVNNSDISLNVYSQVSSPETIRDLHGIDQGGDSIFRSRGCETFSPNGRVGNNSSLDPITLSTERIIQTEKCFQSNESRNNRSNVVPNQITIIESGTIAGNNICLTDRLKNSQEWISFLEAKLELSDNVIDANFRDLERARHCIRDLVRRNAEMKAELRMRDREDLKKKYEKGEIMVEQYWVLKVSLYSGVFFFLSGYQEYFLATAFFVWLALEINING